MSHSDVKRNQGGRKERTWRTRNENDVKGGLHEQENDGKSGKSRDCLKARETLGQEPGRENMQVQRMAKQWGIFFRAKKKKSWIELWSERRKTASWLNTITMKYPQDSNWYTLVPIIILKLQKSYTFFWGPFCLVCMNKKIRCDHFTFTWSGFALVDITSELVV